MGPEAIYEQHSFTGITELPRLPLDGMEEYIIPREMKQGARHEGMGTVYHRVRDNETGLLEMAVHQKCDHVLLLLRRDSDRCLAGIGETAAPGFVHVEDEVPGHVLDRRLDVPVPLFDVGGIDGGRAPCVGIPLIVRIPRRSVGECLVTSRSNSGTEDRPELRSISHLGAPGNLP
jgi:hypothetical protein